MGVYINLKNYHRSYNKWISLNLKMCGKEYELVKSGNTATFVIKTNSLLKINSCNCIGRKDNLLPNLF